MQSVHVAPGNRSQDAAASSHSFCLNVKLWHISIMKNGQGSKWGPFLHYDPEMVRPFELLRTPYHWDCEESFVWSHGTEALNWMLFHYRLVHVGLYNFEMSWSPDFMLDPSFVGWFGIEYGRPWNRIHHVQYEFTCVYFHSFKPPLGPLGPQALAHHEMRQSRDFAPMRD